MDTHILRFLVDESCDYAVVHALRREGWDVLAVTEVTQRSVDDDLIVSLAEGRSKAGKESCVLAGRRDNETFGAAGGRPSVWSYWRRRGR